MGSSYGKLWGWKEKGHRKFPGDLKKIIPETIPEQKTNPTR